MLQQIWKNGINLVMLWVE